MMKINKRELLKKLTQENLWERLSSEEIRLYLLLIIFADKVAGLANSYPEKEQLHLANQLRYSTSVIFMGLDIIKTNVSPQKQEFTRRIERIETSLLEVINNLKLALIREYINKDDYDETGNLIEQLHCKLIKSYPEKKAR